MIGPKIVVRHQGENWSTVLQKHKQGDHIFPIHYPSRGIGTRQLNTKARRPVRLTGGGRTGGVVVERSTLVTMVIVRRH